MSAPVLFGICCTLLVCAALLCIERRLGHLNHLATKRDQRDAPTVMTINGAELANLRHRLQQKRATTCPLSDDVEPDDPDGLLPGWVKINDTKFPVRSVELTFDQQRRARVEIAPRVRFRDGDNCRACGVDVQWLGRAGNRSGHLSRVPRYASPDRPEGWVVTCRLCYIRLRETPSMMLLPVPRRPRYGTATAEYLRRNGYPDVLEFDTSSSTSQDQAAPAATPEAASEPTNPTDPTAKPGKVFRVEVRVETTADVQRVIRRLMADGGPGWTRLVGVFDAETGEPSEVGRVGSEVGGAGDEAHGEDVTPLGTSDPAPGYLDPLPVLVRGEERAALLREDIKAATVATLADRDRWAGSTTQGAIARAVAYQQVASRLIRVLDADADRTPAPLGIVTSVAGLHHPACNPQCDGDTHHFEPVAETADAIAVAQRAKEALDLAIRATRSDQRAMESRYDEAATVLTVAYGQAEARLQRVLDVVNGEQGTAL